VYQQLAQLIRDGIWLKSYIAAVMRVEQETFTTAYNAMGPTKVSQSTAVSIVDSEAMPEAIMADRQAMGTSNAVSEPAQQQVCHPPHRLAMRGRTLGSYMGIILENTFSDVGPKHGPMHLQLQSFGAIVLFLICLPKLTNYLAEQHPRMH